MTQTLAPWHICEATKRDLKLVRDDNGFCVAQAIQPGNSRAAYINAEANLHLIAAAPELLAALKYVRKALFPSQGISASEIADIDSIIAKATGA